MSLHESTFQYLAPTPDQTEDMKDVRALFSDLADKLDSILPDGPDKTHIFRVLRTAAMWANVTITRQPDGAPRQ